MWYELKFVDKIGKEKRTVTVKYDSREELINDFNHIKKNADWCEGWEMQKPWNDGFLDLMLFEHKKNNQHG